MTQREEIGPGAIESVGQVVRDLDARNVFLVTDRVSFGPCGAEEKLTAALSEFNVTSFSDFDPNPHVEDVRKGMVLFTDAEPDVVIAVGGGSVIDMAKLINFFGSAELDPEVYLADKRLHGTRDGCPLIAVPTTAGTGSEATHFAVLYVGHTKYSVAEECILPDVVVMDPRLTLSMPKYVTASTGMDALGQAIESYWCVNSTEESKAFARKAIGLIIPALPAAIENGDIESRQAMAEGANLAGKAINISKTTAAHAVSYPITSFFGIAHGHAVGLTLPSMLVYNAGATEDDTTDVRGADYVSEVMSELVGMLSADTPAGAADTLNKLMTRIGLETRLSALGVRTDDDIQTILDNGFNPARVKNNPRLLTREALERMLNLIR